MEHDVFISYSATDKVIADSIVASLEESNIRCWIAPRDIKAGADWAESIMNAINESRLFILVFSENSNNSQQVIREIQRSVNNEIPILPFRIQDVPLSEPIEYLISSTHWLDAITPPIEKHIELLTERAMNILGKGSNSTSIPNSSLMESKKLNKMTSEEITALLEGVKYNWLIRGISIIFGLFLLIGNILFLTPLNNGIFNNPAMVQVISILYLPLALLLLFLGIFPYYLKKMLLPRFKLTNKRYILLVIISILLVLAVFNFGESVKDKQLLYVNNTQIGYSFYQPPGWTGGGINKQAIFIPINYDKNFNPVGNASKKTTYGMATTFVDVGIFKPQSNTSLEEFYKNWYNIWANHDQSLVTLSENNISIANTTGYKRVMKDTSYGEIFIISEVWFEKNNSIYLIRLVALEKDYEAEKQNFDMVINSFQTNNVQMNFNVY